MKLDLRRRLNDVLLMLCFPALLLSILMLLMELLVPHFPENEPPDYFIMFALASLAFGSPRVVLRVVAGFVMICTAIIAVGQHIYLTNHGATLHFCFFPWRK